MTISWLLLAAHVPAEGQRGGMVRYVVEVAKGLAVHPDVDLHVVSAPQAQGFWESIVAMPERVHPMSSVPTAAQAWLERRGLGCAAFKRNYDVVHGAKHILPTHPRGAGVLTVHDFLPLDRPGDFGRAKRALLPGPYLASIAEADALICVSAATRDRLASYVPEAIDRAHVVPLAGSVLSEVSPEPVPRLSERSFALVVGDDSARKNLRFLTHLWPDVARRHADAILAIVGPPTWKDDGSQGPEDPGVQRLGFLPDAQLAWAYRNATVVLCPSVLEGFGLPAREALDLGARLITSDDPALCEVSGSAAQHLRAADPESWIEAISAAFAEPAKAPPEVASLRTWADVANETVRVVADALHR